LIIVTATDIAFYLLSVVRGESMLFCNRKNPAMICNALYSLESPTCQACVFRNGLL
jgi:hypothetical protein